MKRPGFYITQKTKFSNFSLQPQNKTSEKNIAQTNLYGLLHRSHVQNFRGK